MNRLSIVISLLAIHGLLSLAVFPEGALAQGTASKPNIVFIMADDLTLWDIEPYGSKQVHTPSLARLAGEGVCLDNMFNVVPICAPTRQTLLTGLGPVRNGAYPNHSEIHAGIKTLPTYLQDLGYRTALIGKKHYQPESSYPFEFLGGRGHDDGDGQDVDLALAEAYIRKADDAPFFLMFTSNQPHSPWNRGDASAYDPHGITLAPNMVDTELTRQQMASYFAEITYLDSLVGVCLDIVERSGQGDNTIVVFATEQGNSFPFSKWTLYDQGLRSGFIVRWPGMVAPATRNAALLQYTDVLPTLIDIAGGDPENTNTGSTDTRGNTGFDGHSFKDVLLGKRTTQRAHVYGVNTTRGIISGSDAYAIRSVRDTRFLYIHNLNYRQTYSNTVVGSPLFRSWMAADSTRASAYLTRPEEELYDVVQDPYQLVNLANDPRYDAIKAKLKTELAQFMDQQGDEGVETEMKAFERQPRRQGNAAAVAPAGIERRPNIVVIMADDLDSRQLSCYGGENLETTHIDRLASEGLKFNAMIASETMCVPTRASLFTGMYPARHGAYQNHKPVHDDLQSVGHYLNALGYRVGLTGKDHVTRPTAVFPFDIVPGFEPNCVSPTDDYFLDSVRGYILRDEPYCLFVMSNNPHRPWTVGDPDEFDPDQLKLPAHWVDTERTRENFRRYLAEVRRLDDQVGDIVDLLTETGQDQHTIVIFLGEQGPQFPGGKWTLYDNGQKSAMIVKWPGTVVGNRETDAIVQYEDVTPTLIDILGGDPVAGLDGRSFKSVLESATAEHRDVAYGIHNNIPEGPAYPMRSIRGQRYKLIWNLTPDSAYYIKYSMNTEKADLDWPTWLDQAAVSEEARKRTDRIVRKPAIEFYDLQADPDELENLAGDPAYRPMVDAYSAKLKEWMADQDDPGAALDVPINRK